MNSPVFTFGDLFAVTLELTILAGVHGGLLLPVGIIRPFIGVELYLFVDEVVFDVAV
jgi:hypothetical protein